MARKGKGARFWLWDTTIVTPALVKIGELQSVKPPARSRDTIDTTHHESVGDYREFISSLIDAGEVTININYMPGGDSDILLEAAFAAGDDRAFAIDMNQSTPTGQRRLTGTAIVTGFDPSDIVIDDKMSATITLKVTGPITYGVSPA